MPKKMIVRPVKTIKGEIHVPGDKSISHRAIMLGALAQGETIIHNFLNSADCIATAYCFKAMGIEIQINKDLVVVKGKGLNGLSKPDGILDVGNSGTTIRLLSGILAGQGFESEITGDSSIQKRPMKRIAEPLKLMGADIKGSSLALGEIYPPLSIKGGKLHGIGYKMPVASAQVKSCVLLAGLFTKGETLVEEPALSRDHTERMLAFFGVPVKRFANKVSLLSNQSFPGREIFVPGDISSAAYFIAAGILVPEVDIIMRDVGTNPTRTGIFEVLHRMGADIGVHDEEIESGEPRANLKLQTSNLSRVAGSRNNHINNIKEAGKPQMLEGIKLDGEIIPRIIDEIPIIAVLATQAKGDTIIKDAKELRVKESDRIKTIISELSKMGARIDELPDGMVIHGGTKLRGATIDSHGDHRIAMSCAIAGLTAEGETTIENTDCIETSFPGFENILKSLT